MYIYAEFLMFVNFRIFRKLHGIRLIQRNYVEYRVLEFHRIPLNSKELRITALSAAEASNDQQTGSFKIMFCEPVVIKCNSYLTFWHLTKGVFKKEIFGNLNF